MQAEEEKQKLISSKLKGKPKTPAQGGALSFLLANSDRYNYLPLPTPGPQVRVRVRVSPAPSPSPSPSP